MEHARRIRTPFPQRWKEMRRTHLTVMVWLVAATLAVFLLLGRAGSVEFVGLARALEYEVSAETEGTVKDLRVAIFSDIEAGQVVAQLDDAGLLARLATRRAIIGQLNLQLEAEFARLGFREAALQEDRRRFQIDEQRLLLDKLALQVQVESDEIELARLNLQVGRSEPITEAGFLAQSEFDDLRLERDRVARTIEESRTLLYELEREYETVIARRQSFDHQFPPPEVDRLLAPFDAAVHAEQQRMEELRVERARLTLRSPVSGRVSQVLARPGQAVVPGEPVVLVVERAATEIIAFASGRVSDRIVERTEVIANRRASPNVVAESLITAVGPAIQTLPQQLWRDPAVPEFGLPFLVAAVPSLELKPGEMVVVRLKQR